MTEKDSLRAAQLDATDADGVVRASLTAGDDLAGRRLAPAAGLIVRDTMGRERGGVAVLDGDDGHRVLSVLDHPGGDAIGMMVDDEGAAGFFINDAPDPDRKPRSTRLTRLTAAIGADGTPAIALSDEEGRPRLRLTVASDGAGAIEFLDARGSVVHQLVPEHSAT